MMGRHVAQRERYELVNLEKYVPQDHLLRAVDRYLDLTAFQTYPADSYSHTGRPSIDPERMIRMLIIGCCYGIRSERRPREEVHLNLAYRRFCHLGIHDKVPDHSTFSRNRHGRFQQSRCERKKVEMLFAHLKCILRLDRLRGRPGAHDGFWLAATAQNLRRMAKQLCLGIPGLV